MKRRSKRGARFEPAATHIELSDDDWKLINAIKAETVDKLTIEIIRGYADRCKAAGITDEVFVGTLVLSILTNLVKTLATFKDIPQDVYVANQRYFQTIAQTLQDCAEEAMNSFIIEHGGKL